MNADTALADKYREILQEYLKEGGEIFLSQGYDLARRALVDGRGVLDLADIHHRALQQICEDTERDVGLMWAAGDFFAECLSPFEMSHRGAQEGTRALRHLNQFLESELKRIAHALHDEAGQLLASVHIAVVDIASDLPPPIRLRFEKVERLLTQIEVELRNMSHDLRPTVLDNLGLLPALEFLAERVAKRNGLNVSVSGGAGERLPTTVETALYRIVQEALNNAVKHAKASTIKIELQRTPLKVACSVRDNGLGFDVHRQSGGQGLGLLGIRERLNVLGGSLHLTAEPRHGTTLLAEIPLGD
ncbi:MAG TPA: ATP-binding protein [Burkholderiales bacterium]|jgi:signal transduction histidine kinase